jgi:ABC-type branched-subunit amino acid transport system ATPase component
VTDPILEARDVRRSFGGLAAVSGVSIGFRAGAITSIIGPNGAGKTTLFNVLTGFVAPDAGQVFLDGTDITAWPPHRVAGAGLARSFQDLRVLTRMTVLENLLLARPRQTGERLLANVFAAARVRREEAAARERALDALAFVRLEAKADERAQRLSYGQQKLLVIARLLAMEPRVVMLDEPTAGLDPTMIERISDTVRRLAGAGTTVVLIEHNIDVVRALSDEVVFMNEGRVLTTGSPKDVLTDRTLVSVYLGLSA